VLRWAHQVVDRWQGPTCAGLTAQPVPRRPGRGRARLRVGRTAGQRQRRHPSGHDLAIAAQGFHPPRPGHARPQPRSRPPARYRHGQPPRRPATPTLGPVFASLNPGALPAHGQRTSCTSGSAARSSTPSWAPTWWSSCTARVTPANNHRAWAIIRRADRSHRLAGQRTSRSDRRHADRADRVDRISRFHQPQEREMVADVR
jgi:hypothetical protein